MLYWAQTHSPDLSNPVSLTLKTKTAPLGATKYMKAMTNEWACVYIIGLSWVSVQA